LFASVASSTHRAFQSSRRRHSKPFDRFAAWPLESLSFSSWLQHGIDAPCHRDWFAPQQDICS
jgi:hypothetical protein